jgi:hypothetical protein
MIGVLGTTAGVYVGLTLVIMGFAAYMTGMGLANTWRPIWQPVFYAALLGFADRFLVFSLFDGELLSLTGYLIDSVSLILISLFAYRSAQARRMVSQYPWLYERAGLFGWREKG